MFFRMLSQLKSVEGWGRILIIHYLHNHFYQIDCITKKAIPKKGIYRTAYGQEF